MGVQCSDQQLSLDQCGDFVLINFRHYGFPCNYLGIVLLGWVQIGIEQKDAGIILHLSPLHNTVLPGILDQTPIDDDILLSLDDIIYNKSFRVKLAFVKFIKQEKSLCLLILLDFNGNQSASGVF